MRPIARLAALTLMIITGTAGSGVLAVGIILKHWPTIVAGLAGPSLLGLVLLGVGAIAERIRARRTPRLTLAELARTDQEIPDLAFNVLMWNAGAGHLGDRLEALADLDQAKP